MDASCWCEVELEIMLRGKLPSESTFRCINPPHAHTTHTHKHTLTHTDTISNRLCSSRDYVSMGPLNYKGQGPPVGTMEALITDPSLVPTLLATVCPSVSARLFTHQPSLFPFPPSLPPPTRALSHLQTSPNVGAGACCSKSS